MPGGIKPINPKMRITIADLEEKIRKRWCLASYLILNINFRDLVTIGEKELPAKFSKEMAGLVYAYIKENKKPPAAISQTVLNVSEDLAAGRQVQLRAGDYIAIQNYMRRK
jgi:hypothetical protein